MIIGDANQIMGYFICSLMIIVPVLCVICVPLIHAAKNAPTMANEFCDSYTLERLQRDQEYMVKRFSFSSERTLRRNRIHYLEPLARNGDLIAFREWEQLIALDRCHPLPLR